tara:strand:+ start:2795 stop:3049 length:255 start_codon:yes stop_codon:yes gene_type:complete
MTNKPMKSWKSGNISGAIWVNERDINGSKVEFKTVSLRRSWKKEGDVWRDETLNFRRQDIPKLMAILYEIQKELFLVSGDEEDE